jgi:hypothetical protein
MLLKLANYLQFIPNMFHPILAIFKFTVIEMEVSKVHAHSYENDVYINLEYQVKGHSAWLNRQCSFLSE